MGYKSASYTHERVTWGRLSKQISSIFRSHSYTYRTLVVRAIDMSAAPASGAAPANKAVATDKSADTAKDSKPTAALEEDDEFEDFPVENWTQEETEVPGDNTHLWEESWDDDDTSEDFSAQLKEELKKVEASKKR